MTVNQRHQQLHGSEIDIDTGIHKSKETRENVLQQLEGHSSKERETRGKEAGHNL